MQRCLLAASRTSWGGDVFFIIRDLFGGDGVIVVPIGTGGGEAVDIQVVTSSSSSASVDGGSRRLSVYVKTKVTYGLYADEEGMHRIPSQTSLAGYFAAAASSPGRTGR